MTDRYISCCLFAIPKWNKFHNISVTCFSRTTLPLQQRIPSNWQTSIMSWQRITDKVQQDLLDSIPSKWRLPSNFDVSAESRVDTFIEERKLLSSRQLLLTSMDVSELASEIRSGNFTAFEVVEAFCARAAYAHQLVRAQIDSKQFISNVTDKLSHVILPGRGFRASDETRQRFQDQSEGYRSFAWRPRCHQSSYIPRPRGAVYT